MPGLRVKLSDPTKPYRDPNPAYSVKGDAVLELPADQPIPDGIQSAIGGGKLLITNDEPRQNALTDVMRPPVPVIKATWDTPEHWEAEVAGLNERLALEAAQAAEAASAQALEEAKDEGLSDKKAEAEAQAAATAAAEEAGAPPADENASGQADNAAGPAANMPPEGGENATQDAPGGGAGPAVTATPNDTKEKVEAPKAPASGGAKGTAKK